VVLGGSLAEVQALTDRAVREPVGDQAGDLELAIRENRRPPARMPEGLQLGLDLGGQRPHAESFGGGPSLLEQRDGGSEVAVTAAVHVQAGQLAADQGHKGWRSDSLRSRQRLSKEAFGRVVVTEELGQLPAVESGRAFIAPIIPITTWTSGYGASCS